MAGQRGTPPLIAGKAGRQVGSGPQIVVLSAVCQGFGRRSADLWDRSACASWKGGAFQGVQGARTTGQPLQSTWRSELWLGADHVAKYHGDLPPRLTQASTAEPSDDRDDRSSQGSSGAAERCVCGSTPTRGSMEASQISNGSA